MSHITEENSEEILEGRGGENNSQKEIKKQGTNAGNEPLIKKDFTELQKEQMLKKILLWVVFCNTTFIANYEDFG